MSRRSAKGWLLAGVITVFLAVPATAPAATQNPTLNSLTQSNRLISASWTLAGGTTAAELDFAPTGDVDGDGFLTSVNQFVPLDPVDTSFTDTQQLPPGTYFVQVLSEDANFFYPSNVMSVTLPADPTPVQPTFAPPPVFTPAAAPVVKKKTTTKKCKKGKKLKKGKCLKKKKRAKRKKS